ncbi:MAG: hypothetical protein B0D91_11255, partial [Oceanospirillales bacterium LUC14_002_19_P2]
KNRIVEFGRGQFFALLSLVVTGYLQMCVYYPLILVSRQPHQAIPGSKLIVYPNVGHMPMEEIPEQSASDLIQFLEASEESSVCSA